MTEEKRNPTGRTVVSPPMAQIPVRTEEGHRIKEALRKDRPLPDVDYAEIEARILAWGAR